MTPRPSTAAHQSPTCSIPQSLPAGGQRWAAGSHPTHAGRQPDALPTASKETPLPTAYASQPPTCAYRPAGHREDGAGQAPAARHCDDDLATRVGTSSVGGRAQAARPSWKAFDLRRLLPPDRQIEGFSGRSARA